MSKKFIRNLLNFRKNFVRNVLDIHPVSFKRFAIDYRHERNEETKSPEEKDQGFFTIKPFTVVNYCNLVSLLLPATFQPCLSIECCYINCPNTLDMGESD